MITYDEMGNPITNDNGGDIATPTEFVDAQWQDAVQRWQAAVAALQAQLATHASLRSVAESMGYDELQAWQLQQNRADMLQSAINSLRDSLASASSWAKSTLGLAGLRGLGGLPLVPIAVIVGSISAVAAMTYAIYTYDNELMRREQFRQSYIAAHPNAGPAEIDAAVNAGLGGTLGGISGAAMWIAIAGAVIVFGPHIVKHLNKGGHHGD